MIDADIQPELEATVQRVVERVTTGVRWKFLRARAISDRYAALEVLKAGLEYEMRLALGLPTPGDGA